jgi:hypothetical protein
MIKQPAEDCVYVTKFYTNVNHLGIKSVAARVSRAGAVLQKTVMFVNTASRFIACDDQSVTVTPPQAANVNIGSVLVGTLASFNPDNATDSCSWIVRKVTGITPAGATTKLSTTPASLDDVVSYLN